MCTDKRTEVRPKPPSAWQSNIPTTFYGFKPDFCEGADPESKGVVEHLAGDVQTDLLIPADLDHPWPDLTTAANAERRRGAPR